MLNQFSRTELLLGKEALDKLAGSRVAVFGIGGVGGYVCEALVRSGIGEFDLIDDDKVCLTRMRMSGFTNASSYLKMQRNFHLRNMTTSLMLLTQ